MEEVVEQSTRLQELDWRMLAEKGTEEEEIGFRVHVVEQQDWFLCVS